MNYHILLITLLFTFTKSYGQSKIVTGTILSEDLEPLSGAYIQTLDSAIIVRANEKGDFAIELPSEINELFAWFIAMESDTIVLDGRCHVNLILLNDYIIEFSTVREAQKHFDKRKRNLSPIYKKAYELGLFRNEMPCS